MELPRRTQATDLSDEQLLLLDFLFDRRTSARALAAGEYALHLNVSYTHGLNAAALEATLDDLAARGLVRSDRRRDGAILSLTPAGGHLWEAERSPDWRLYVIDSYECPIDDGLELVSFGSPDPSTLRQFYSVAVDCGLRVPLDQPKEDWTTDPYFIPWKTFGRLARIRFSALTAGSRTDWNLYESRRTW